MVDVSGAAVIESGSGFTIGDVLGRSFSIFQRNFVPFALLAAIAALPYIFFYSAQAVTPGVAPKISATMALPFIVGALLKLVAQAIIVHAAFQDMRGRPIAIGESLRIGLSRFWPIIGLVLLEGIGIGIGTVLLIVPGLILLVAWYVAIPACVVEKLGPWESLKRSAVLTKGHRWKLFGLLLIVGIGAGIVGAILGGIGILAFGTIGTVAAQYITQTVMGAFGAILIIVIYRDLRVSKEGIDTEQIASVFD
jgi:uncharacterized membrane protein